MMQMGDEQVYRWSQQCQDLAGHRQSSPSSLASTVVGFLHIPPHRAAVSRGFPFLASQKSRATSPSPSKHFSRKNQEGPALSIRGLSLSEVTHSSFQWAFGEAGAIQTLETRMLKLFKEN